MGSNSGGSGPCDDVFVMVFDVALKLKALGLEDESLAEYVHGILNDDDVDDEEKHDSLVDFLSAAAEVHRRACIVSLDTPCARSCTRHLQCVQRVLSHVEPSRPGRPATCARVPMHMPHL